MCNFMLWTVLHLIYIVFLLIQLIQLPLQLTNHLVTAALFWPKFYWSLFGPSSQGRSILTILRDPSGEGTNWQVKKDLIIKDYDGCRQLRFGKLKVFTVKPNPLLRQVTLTPTQVKLNVFTSYQVHGNYAHLAPIDKEVRTSLSAGMSTKKVFPFKADPLCLDSIYGWVGRRITEPPKCLLDFLWVTSWHILYAGMYIIGGYSRLTFNRWFGKSRGIKTVEINCFTRESSSRSAPVNFESDGLPFLIDTCADCIISNNRSLFSDLVAVNCTVKTASGEDTRQRYEGTFKLELPDNRGNIHTYMIPQCTYDPYSDYNIIGVPKLCDFFGDAAKGRDPAAVDGTRVTSSGVRTHLVWDHGQHELNFLHSGGPGLPVVLLYRGNRYYNSFFTRMSRWYDDTIRHAFSSSYSVAPSSNYVSDDEGEEMSDDEGDTSDGDDGTDDMDLEFHIHQKNTSWYAPSQSPSLCQPCNPPQTTDEEDENVKKKDAYKFELGENLLYTCYEKGKPQFKSAVYEGMNADGLTHIIRLSDGTKQSVHDSTLQHELQPSFHNIPSTPKEFSQEVNVGISQEEAQRLARPRQLSPIQQELLAWHHRLYHLDFGKIFNLAKLRILPKTLLQCENAVPLCIECQFGKAHRRPWRGKGKYGSIQREEEKKPGDGVSADQIVSAQPGLIPQMSGFLTSERLWGATTFVDHVSDYVYVHLMKSFTIEDTMNAKKAFEKMFTLAGREVKSYRVDNGRFADKQWQEDCSLHNQKLTYCGVGNHAQNGKIEAKNKYLTLTARTLLLHGMRMWPEAISTYFWPFAIKAAAERHNTLHVDSNGRTPESILYDTQPESLPVKSFHPLFCPVFVLDHRLHSAGGSVPKWEPRARCGVYLGHSPLHAGSVALVFNPKTGRVSPAYHVVFDDTFSTVPYMRASSLPPNWEDLVKNSAEFATTEDFELADEWTKAMEDGNAQPLPMVGPQNAASPVTDPYAVIPDQNLDSVLRPASVRPEEMAVQPSEGDTQQSKRVTFASDENAAVSSPSKRQKLTAETPTARIPAAGTSPSSPAATNAQQDENPLAMPPIINLAEAGLRRSARLAEKASNAANTKKAFLTCFFTAMATITTNTIPDHNYGHPKKQLTFTTRMMNKFHEANELYDGTLNSVHLLSFVTEDLSSNEVFTFHQAMKEHDVLDFIEAMKKELKDHTEREHWEVVPRSDMPSGQRAIKSIWSFKRKRLPDGSLLKHKARLCAHGGMQTWGENYWETYSPVVNMLTVRLLLLICKIHKLHSKSVDFVLAFPQADLEEDIWMEIPLGCGIDDPDEGEEYLFKLKKNLYGLKQGSNNWYKHLKAGLENRGLLASDVDPCLYLKEGLAVLTYVDDCILISTSKKTIDDFVHSLQHGPEKFVLTDEGDIDKFLGMEITHNKDGSFEITQPHLITRILQLLKLDANNEWKSSTNSKLTPSEKGAILHRDSEGAPRKADWKYRTAVGMLTYLQGNSRPEIAVHVHQCARFSIDPKRSHERAIIRIGRYLLTSRNRGIIYKPDLKKGLECYVDADFAGGWQHADHLAAESVMSRTGYVLMYAGCPIHWVSKLQTEIALSTAEAEYIALSQALREVIPLMTMMEELKGAFPIEISIPNFNCTVHEDNQSCISMATKQKFSPRTKHIALKYHHFRSYVNSKKIEVHYINTHDQIADALTKPLDATTFFTLRKLLCGW